MLHRRRYFGLDEVAATALDALLAFTPGVPNFAYNGAALGIGDFSNNAKATPYGGWERVLQHYRAGEACAHAGALRWYHTTTTSLSSRSILLLGSCTG